MELKQALQLSLEKIEEVTDLLYQQKEHDAYVLLNDTLLVISDTMQLLFTWYTENSVDSSSQQEMVQILTQAMEAMESKDTVMLADTLKYELGERFESILNEL